MGDPAVEIIMINALPIAATAIIVLSRQAVAADVPNYEVSEATKRSKGSSRSKDDPCSAAV
jgi:hypothetical protein